ncbi:unnamed protein product [Ascophyllum nodosum]|uniref:hypothetical protein Ycf17 n=1 Tax=Silvetia siliquosa TaxID=93837 RepID=UPI001FA6FA7C|nr:hypothetical protein Ycf17 [Silvetia siliquosa]UNP34754.1 hypothetical protein Ycf17 [Silvetia siliquosa]
MNKDYNYNNSIEYKMRWGFYLKNEILNGRGAMIFLIIIILLEIFTHKTIINLIFQR